MFSTSNGMPSEDSSASIERTEGGELKPKATTSAQEKYYVKLQKQQTSIDRLFSIDEESPMRGLGAAKLLLSEAKEKRGMKGKRVAMAAGPCIIEGTVPLGIAKRKRFATAKVRTNVIFQDENGDVTFGSTTYPARVRSHRL